MTQFVADSTDLSTCGILVTPACIRKLYNITDIISGHPNNTIGIYETRDDYYGQHDLDAYFTVFAPSIPNGTHPKFDPVDGAPPPPPGAGSSESAIDFEAAYPLVYPDQVILFQVNDAYYQGASNPVPGPFNTLLDAIDGSYCDYSAYGKQETLPALIRATQIRILVDTTNLYNAENTPLQTSNPYRGVWMRYRCPSSISAVSVTSG